MAHVLPWLNRLGSCDEFFLSSNRQTVLLLIPSNFMGFHCAVSLNGGWARPPVEILVSPAASLRPTDSEL